VEAVRPLKVPISSQSIVKRDAIDMFEHTSIVVLVKIHRVTEVINRLRRLRMCTTALVLICHGDNRGVRIWGSS
jgi:hypothetical protein